MYYNYFWDRFYVRSNLIFLIEKHLTKYFSLKASSLIFLCEDVRSNNSH